MSDKTQAEQLAAIKVRHINDVKRLTYIKNYRYCTHCNQWADGPSVLQYSRQLSCCAAYNGETYDKPKEIKVPPSQEHKDRGELLKMVDVAMIFVRDSYMPDLKHDAIRFIRLCEAVGYDCGYEIDETEMEVMKKIGVNDD